MPVCPRCNQEMKRITHNHVAACQIPPPFDLARLWLDCPTYTTKKLAHIYNVHTDFMRNRLSLAGIPVQIQAKRGHIIRRMNWGRTEEEPQTIPIGKATCKICTILIASNQKYCSFCIPTTNHISQRTSHDLNHQRKQHCFA